MQDKRKSFGNQEALALFVPPLLLSCLVECDERQPGILVISHCQVPKYTPVVLSSWPSRFVKNSTSVPPSIVHLRIFSFSVPIDHSLLFPEIRSQVPMAQNRTPAANALLNGGNQSMLEGIFNPPTNFDEVRRSILGHLGDDDFDSLRMTAPMLDACLSTPAALQGPPGNPPVLRYRADLAYKCEDESLPMPPALPPNGTVS